MAKVLSFKQALKVGLWMLFSALCLGWGPQLADSLARSPNASAGARWLGVVVAVASIVPWVVLVGWGVGVADEYQRQIFFVGTTLAFIGYILLYVAIEVMADAKLTPAGFYVPHLVAGVVMWLIGILVATLYYHLRP